MKPNKKFTKIAVILLLLVAVLLTIYYFSDKIFRVKKETKLVEMNLPPETQDLIIGLELARLQKGKDSVFITGWVLKKDVKEKKKDVYMVLKSNKSTLIFALGNSNLIRPDVKQYFHLDEGIDNHGFEMSFPLSLLKENTYQIGFVIEDKTGKYFAMSAKAVTISNGAVTLTDFK